MPVHGILYNGNAFEFFWFDGTTKPSSLYQGRDTTVPRTRMVVPDLTEANPGSFIDALPPVCAFIFDLMVMTYISGLNAWHMRSVKKSSAEARPRPSLDRWDQALGSAHQTQEIFRDAEARHQTLHIGEADALVQQAMESLQDRYGSSDLARLHMIVDNILWPKCGSNH